MKNLAGSLRRSSPRFVHLFGGFVAQIMEQKSYSYIHKRLSKARASIGVM